MTEEVRDSAERSSGEECSHLVGKRVKAGEVIGCSPSTRERNRVMSNEQSAESMKDSRTAIHHVTQLMNRLADHHKDFDDMSIRSLERIREITVERDELQAQIAGLEAYISKIEAQKDQFEDIADRALEKLDELRAEVDRLPVEITEEELSNGQLIAYRRAGEPWKTARIVSGDTFREGTIFVLLHGGPASEPPEPPNTPCTVSRGLYTQAARRTGISTYVAREFLRESGFRIEGDG